MSYYSQRTCGSNEFTCRHSRQCIFLRFVCDGLSDCSDGSDETPSRCGRDVCKNRIRCLSGRCIPTEYCCNPRLDPTCDKWKRSECCDYPDFPGRSSDYPFDKKYRPPKLQTPDSNYNPSWGLQSAVFVIAGCSLAFVALILLVSFLIAKYLLKRISNRGRTHFGTQSTGAEANNQHDIFCPHASLLIQYNINHGVQIYRPPGPDGALPPPYTEQPLLPNSEDPYGPPSEIGAAPPAYSDICDEGGDVSRRQSLRSDVIRARQTSGESRVSQETLPYDTLPRENATEVPGVHVWSAVHTGTSEL